MIAGRASDAVTRGAGTEFPRFFRRKKLAPALPARRLTRRLGVVLTLIETVTRKVCKVAKEQNDLNAAVAALTAAVSAAVDEIKVETGKILEEVSVHEQIGIDPTAVEDAAGNINSLAAKLSDAVSSARSALSGKIRV